MNYTGIFLEINLYLKRWFSWQPLWQNNDCDQGDNSFVFKNVPFFNVLTVIQEMEIEYFEKRYYWLFV